MCVCVCVKVEKFANALKEFFPCPPTTNASEKWEHFRDAIYTAAITTFGKMTNKLADWFEAHAEERTPVLTSIGPDSAPKYSLPMTQECQGNAR